jgi:putative RecB family exonuclease
MADRPYLSYSQISLYQSCSLRFYFQYVEGIKPQWTPAPLAFGSSIHRAIATHLQAQLEGSDISRPELESWFERDWRETQEQEDISFTKADASTLLNQGKGLLSVYLDAPPLAGYQLCGIEEPFEISLGPDLPPLKGQIDALYMAEADSERVYIVDFKTASAAYPDGRAAHDYQLDAYALAMAQQGYPVEKMTAGFSVLIKTKQPKFQHISAGRTARQLQRFTRVAAKVYEAIQADIFYPQPDWHCSDCPYRAMCEAF